MKVSKLTLNELSKLVSNDIFLLRVIKATNSLKTKIDLLALCHTRGLSRGAKR